MDYCIINVIVGKLPDGAPGRWIEATIKLHNEHAFTFQADLCVRQPDGTFSLDRIEQTVRQPFTAECILAMLAYLVAPPHEPTRTGLHVYAKGNIALTNGELSRLLEPEVRQCDTANPR